MNGRTKFVVAGMTLLFFISWYASLMRLFGQHFWDRQYALEKIASDSSIVDSSNSTTVSASSAPALDEVNSSYYGYNRYLYFAPHVFGAIFWWNLYFLQLIPFVRHAYNKKIHRLLGRFLMFCAVLQTASGVGLAFTSHSKIILLISIILAVAASFCIYHAWRYAINRDIRRHKYWAIRFVGYMHTIALQRFWFMVLLISHEMGWCGMYPNLEGATVSDANQVILDMFDHSFVLCFLTAVLVTEWYLAGEEGMLEQPGALSSYETLKTQPNGTGNTTTSPPSKQTSAYQLPVTENLPLLK